LERAPRSAPVLHRVIQSDGRSVIMQIARCLLRPNFLINHITCKN